MHGADSLQNLAPRRFTALYARAPRWYESSHKVMHLARRDRAGPTSFIPLAYAKAHELVGSGKKNRYDSSCAVCMSDGVIVDPDLDKATANPYTALLLSRAFCSKRDT